MKLSLLVWYPCYTGATTNGHILNYQFSEVHLHPSETWPLSVMLIFRVVAWDQRQRKSWEAQKQSERPPFFPGALVPKPWLPFFSNAPPSLQPSRSLSDTAQDYPSQCQSSPSCFGVHLGHWILCQGSWLLEPESECCCAISSSPTNTNSQPQMAPNLSSQDHKGKKSFQIKKLKLATKVPHGSNL